MTARPIFIGGCPRSGLTLARLVLDSHPQISIGPDAGIVGMALAHRDIAATLGDLLRSHYALPPEQISANFGQTIGGLLDERARRSGKERAGEKSAMNILVFEDLARIFPEALFIHCVRDGRDVAASLLQRQWRHPQNGRLFDYCADAGASGRYWSDLTKVGLNAEDKLGARVHRLVYEDLVAKPAETLRQLFGFLDVRWSEDPLRFHERPHTLAGGEVESEALLRQPLSQRQVGRWRRDLTAEQQQQVEKAAGATLRSLGYA